MTEPLHLDIRIPGRPMPFARPGHYQDDEGKTRGVNSARYRNWKAAAKLYAGVAKRGRPRTFPYLNPVHVAITVYADHLEITVEGNVAERRPPGLHGDLDNYAKAAIDALVDAKIIGDDKQIASLIAIFPVPPITITD